MDDATYKDVSGRATMTSGETADVTASFIKCRKNISKRLMHHC